MLETRRGGRIKLLENRLTRFEGSNLRLEFIPKNLYTISMIKRIHSTLFYASNLEKTAKFYEQLGFKVEKEEDLVRVKLGDFRLAFIDENQTPIKNESGMTPKGLGIYTYVEVDNVDQYFEFLKSQGVEPRTKPKDWPWRKREFVVRDPDGYKLVFYSPVK